MYVHACRSNHHALSSKSWAIGLLGKIRLLIPGGNFCVTARGERSYFLGFLACWRQSQQINVISVKRVVQIDVPSLAGSPHGKKPNMFSYLSSIFRVTRQNEFRPFGELIGANCIEFELGKVLLEEGIFYDFAELIQVQQRSRSMTLQGLPG